MDFLAEGIKLWGCTLSVLWIHSFFFIYFNKHQLRAVIYSNIPLTETYF